MKAWFHHILGFLLLISLCPMAATAGPNPRFRHLTIEDGLSQSAVYALLQDRDGFIWIGTKDGLNKYDGYRFTIFQHNPFDSTTLSNSFITNIFEDSRGNLWVGTREGGLNRLNRDTENFQRYRHNPSNPTSLSNNRITAITEDSSGALWIGTRNGLNHLPLADVEQKSPIFNKLADGTNIPDSLANVAVEALLTDRRGNVWIGTFRGLYRIFLSNGETGALRVDHFTAGKRGPASLLDNEVHSLYQSSDGRLWVGTRSGLNRFDPQSESFSGFPHHFRMYRRGWGNVLDIQEDGHGSLWLTTPGELMIFDANRQTYQYIRHNQLVPASLSSNNLTCIIRDRSGVLWIGSNGYGLNLYDPKADRFLTFRRPHNIPSRISGFSIRAILPDNRGNIWISADVLYRWNRRTGEVHSFETNSDHPQDFGNTGLFALQQDSSGAIWGAGYEGLFRYSPENGRIRRFGVTADSTRGLMEKVALAMHPAAQGGRWVATQNYISRYNAVTDRFTHYRYRQNPATRELAICQIYRDSRGVLWLATDDGLVRFDPASAAFRYFRNDPAAPGSLSNNVVLCIQPDPDHPDSVLWLGTGGGGLNRFHVASGRFERFGKTEGLPNNVVYAALPDEDGHLWLSTNNGLSRFHVASGRFRNFSVSDGLQSNEFNADAYFKSRDGELFFGGINGLTYFYPGNISDNPHVPNIVITQLRIFNREVTPHSHPRVLRRVVSRSSDIHLSYRQNVITLEFAALDYSASSRNRYAYKMEGFNDSWINAGTQRTATFTNLPPGTYRFRVKGSNNDGVWNMEGASLTLHIMPPFWRTWWAYLSYAIVLLAALYGLRRYELNRLQLKNKLTVEQLEGDKLREMDQMKSRFFANISHEFRTPLTLILGQIDRVMSRMGQREDHRRLEVALQNARRLLNLINQLLDLSKLEAGRMPLRAKPTNIVPFLKNLTFSFEAMAEQKKIRLHFHCPYEVILVNYEPDKMEKIFFNLLSNAFSFTPEGGSVSVLVSCRIPDLVKEEVVNRVAIRVSDDGGGIPADHLPYIFNRFYQVNSFQSGDREGSGIGLALVRELVDLHQGEISVVSQMGKGTTFTVWLPVREAPRRPTVPQNILAQPKKQTRPTTDPVPDQTEGKGPVADALTDPPGGSAPIILIVEDHSDVRAYVREQLEDRYRVLEAGDGKAGAAVALGRIPDLIITDVMMPEMDGYQMAALLKGDEKTCHIPIIMLTAKAEISDKVEGLETGVDDYLIKPFSARELNARVRNLIDIREKLRKQFREATIVKPAEVTAIPIEQELLQKVLATVEAHLGDERFDVSRLAEAVGMSVSQLNRKLRALVDQPAGRLLRSMRLQRAADLLKQNGGTIAEICYQVGFNDQANFTRAFKKQFGASPGVFRQRRESR